MDHARRNLHHVIISVICDLSFLLAVNDELKRNVLVSDIPIKHLLLGDSRALLSPIHTADADETKLSSLVASAVCTRIRN